MPALLSASRPALVILTWLATISVCRGKEPSSVLEILNQPVTPSLAYPTALDQNLVSLRASEMGEIDRQWKDKGAVAPVVSKKEARDRKNRFFQERVQSLNAPLTDWIASTSRKPQPSYRAIAEKVQQQVTNHPVAGLAHTQSLPQSGEIGYCFGRALLSHYLLLQAGVPQRDIVKVFALGELRVEKQFWRFHVAVGVRDPQAGILMVDPLQPEAVSIESWMRAVEQYDIKRPFSRVRFYLTDPRKFFPAFGAYHFDQLSDPVVRKYFSALLASLN